MTPPDTIWHKESLKLKEIFGTREGFKICPHQLFPGPIKAPRDNLGAVFGYFVKTSAVCTLFLHNIRAQLMEVVVSCLWDPVVPIVTAHDNRTTHSLSGPPAPISP